MNLYAVIEKKKLNFVYIEMWMIVNVIEMQIDDCYSALKNFLDLKALNFATLHSKLDVMLEFSFSFVFFFDEYHSKVYFYIL